MDNSGQTEPAINPQHSELLVNNLRSNNAVYFNQQVAQPVVAPMIALNPVVSGLRTLEANTISATRLCNWTHLNPQPVLRLAQDGLIKIRSSSLSGSPETLRDFCKFDVCASPLS
jgi:hypothetical protein